MLPAAFRKANQARKELIDAIKVNLAQMQEKLQDPRYAALPYHPLTSLSNRSISIFPILGKEVVVFFWEKRGGCSSNLNCVRVSSYTGGCESILSQLSP